MTDATAALAEVVVMEPAASNLRIYYYSVTAVAVAVAVAVVVTVVVVAVEMRRKGLILGFLRKDY